MKIRNRLKDLMEEKGIKTVAELSKDTGIYYGTLLNFYHQKYENFNPVIVAALCKALDCKINDLLELTDHKAS